MQTDRGMEANKSEIEMLKMRQHSESLKASQAKHRRNSLSRLNSRTA
jgi:hypothetical protein